MDEPVVVVTGAAGFLGSAITVDLSGDHHVVAIDCRQPDRALIEASAGVTWQQADIADKTALADGFRDVVARLGRIDVVIHFAAFYHFGSDWRHEYQRTNVDGTANVLDLSLAHGAGRLIFASSVAAMAPPPIGSVLTERTPTSDFIPYAKSKSIGENLIRDRSDSLASIVLRIGGVFTDWCELPPLYSLVRMWKGRWPLNRLIVGEGKSGVPYIYRQDLVRCVRACIKARERLDSHEVLLASCDGAVSHRQLWDTIQETCVRQPRPIFLPVSAARVPIGVKTAWGTVTGKRPYERLWMLNYVDRPWAVDTTYTRTKLGWSCTPELGIRDRLPALLRRRDNDPSEWERRNRQRNEGRYVYQPD